MHRRFIQNPLCSGEDGLLCYGQVFFSRDKRQAALLGPYAAARLGGRQDFPPVTMGAAVVLHCQTSFRQLLLTVFGFYVILLYKSPGN